MNAYVYVSNNPVTKIDPSGLKAWEDGFGFMPEEEQDGSQSDLSAHS
jgi:hypothetical protein